MSAPFTRRLAGIRFEDRPPEPAEKLPRMDIAVFVGFAAAGPLHRPVAVEDAAHFAQIFGADLPLAWDVARSTQGYALLGPAVRAFFQNGGRRCWIVRVAARPETGVLSLVGLARIEGKDLAPAFAHARAPGSWADGISATTALRARAFEVLDWDPCHSSLTVRLAPRETLRAGDLLRLTLPSEGCEIFLEVIAQQPALESLPETNPGAIQVSVRLLGCLRSVDPAETAGVAWSATWVRVPENQDGQRVTVVAPYEFAESLPLSLPEEAAFELAVPAHFSPAAGTLLQIEAAGAPTHRLWMVVDDFFAADVSSPTSRATVRGRLFHWSQAMPAMWGEPAVFGQKLTFELRVRQGESDSQVLTDLGFLAAQGQCWNALPADDAFFAGANLREAIKQAKAEPFEELWQAAAEPRFPLAGSLVSGASFIPIAMGALAGAPATAQHRGGTALERDGLASYASSLFIDPRLLLADATTLLSEADFIRYELEDRQTLTGMHAALGVEEATLIAVPDAMHRGWVPAEPAPPAPPLPSAPLPHPKWWHFLACDPPETPPAEAAEPARGHFIECALPLPKPPSLSWRPVEDDGTGVTPIATTGAFILEWTSPDEALFILEEAGSRDFADAYQLWSGTARHFTVRVRPPGIYYYRVRAELGGETSNWSQGVVVAVRVAVGWENETGPFDVRRLVDIHRALLRICAARADLFAVLALPQEFGEDEALTHLRELKAPFLHPAPDRPLPLNPGEATAFSYAALYHPWLTLRTDSGALRSFPPDGAAAGIIARRTLARGAWLAPANETFAEALALTPVIDPERQLELLLAQINLIREEPQGIIALSADTLSDDPDLRPINVRRLLILLRRAALKLGDRYVFETNDASLRRAVQRAFESMLQRLFVGGAFAGATPAASYQVVTDDSLNPPTSVEQGRFRVDLKVAPSLPMSFLTVRLAQLGDRSFATELS